MIFRGICFLPFFFLLSVAADPPHADDLLNNGPITREEFASFDRAIDMNKGDDLEHFLRGRRLQTGNVCEANSPLNVHLPQGNINFCNELPNYPCTCTGAIGETSCSYCMIRIEPNKISCQVSGSSVTFSDGTNAVTTCKCNYLGNGLVSQDCYQESCPVPIPAPAVVIAPPPMPIPARVPTVAVPAVAQGSAGTTAGTTTGNINPSSKSKKF